MTTKLNNDKTAVIETEHHWVPVKKRTPPLGAKLLLIDKRYGVAVIGIYTKDGGWTHWCGLPKFND
jgi:hypothetical protein